MSEDPVVSMRDTLERLNEILERFEMSIVAAVVFKHDKALLPLLRTGYLAAQDAYNLVDKKMIPKV